MGEDTVMGRGWDMAWHRGCGRRGGGHGRGNGEGSSRNGMTFTGLPGVLMGPGYFYRPRQVLLGETASKQPDLTRRLLRAHGVPDDKLNAQFAKAGLDVRAYLLPARVNIPRLIARLRATEVG